MDCFKRSGKLKCGTLIGARASSLTVLRAEKEFEWLEKHGWKLMVIRFSSRKRVLGEDWFRVLLVPWMGPSIVYVRTSVVLLLCIEFIFLL